MKRVVGLAVVGLAICTFFVVLAVADTVKQGGRQPYWVRASATMVIDTTTGYGMMTETGFGNHVGQETNFGMGFVDPNGTVTGSGTLTASNGDKIFWDSVAPLGGQTVITLMGGTGRFAHVTGQVLSGESQNVEMIQHGPLLITRFDGGGEGWISY